MVFCTNSESNGGNKREVCLFKYFFVCPHDYFFNFILAVCCLSIWLSLWLLYWSSNDCFKKRVTHLLLYRVANVWRVFWNRCYLSVSLSDYIFNFYPGFLVVCPSDHLLDFILYCLFVCRTYLTISLLSICLPTWLIISLTFILVVSHTVIL